MDVREQRESLPVFEYRQDLVQAIRDHNLLVVIGETGSGKTTQIPQYILEEFPEFKRVVITQPRRIAAITVAKRVSEEHGSKLGSTIGYTIRFDDMTSPDTVLRYMTDGVLLREATNDPLLSQYSVVIIDEAHERTVETDILFGLLKRTHWQRPDLKILVMSATLNVEKFSDFFDGCPIFSIPGRTFPVALAHRHVAKLSSLRSNFVDKAVETVMHIHCTEPAGDVLVFLTGQNDIERACKETAKLEAELDYDRDVKYFRESDENNHDGDVRGMDIFPIYASLETFEQRAIFERPRRGYRKVVFATNIAQTSVTIPGIRYVVDSGFVKQKSYDPNTGMDALLITEISQAAAIQRAGRAGRTEEGRCYRLYSREEFEHMNEETVPEIQRSSLLGTVLSLKKMGIIDILHFDFIDAPDRDLVVNALKQLFLLGAINDVGELTPIGDLMAQFPLNPFYSRALIAGAQDHHCSSEILSIVSCLSVEDIFITPSSRHPERQHDAEVLRESFAHDTGDHLTLLNIYKGWQENGRDREWCRENYLNSRNLDLARNIRHQLVDIMDRLQLPIVRTRPLRMSRKRKSSSITRSWIDHVDPVPILKSLVTAYYTHLCKRHAHRPVFYHYATSANLFSPVSQAHAYAPEANSSLLALNLHPQCSLLPALEPDTIRLASIDWVIYTTVTYTNKAVMRHVSKVLYDWVEEIGGMTKLKNIDKVHLSGVPAEGEPNPMVEPAPSSNATIDDTKELQEMIANQRRQEKIDALRERALKRRKQ